jgi:hypothetical protein
MADVRPKTGEEEEAEEIGVEPSVTLKILPSRRVRTTIISSIRHPIMPLGRCIGKDHQIVYHLQDALNLLSDWRGRRVLFRVLPTRQASSRAGRTNGIRNRRIQRSRKTRRKRNRINRTKSLHHSVFMFLSGWPKKPCQNMVRDF